MCGDKDADGFYRGECAGREGYIPCNMVSEIQVENNEIKRQLLKQGFLPADTPMESIGTVSPLCVLCPHASLLKTVESSVVLSSFVANAAHQNGSSPGSECLFSGYSGGKKGCLRSWFIPDSRVGQHCPELHLQLLELVQCLKYCAFELHTEAGEADLQ